MANRDKPASTNYDAEFCVLAVRYLDGSASPDEVEYLGSHLAAEPDRCELFANLCISVAGLDEIFASPFKPEIPLKTRINP